MNLEKIFTVLIGGAITVTALTTVFGRKNSAAVLDSGGRAVGGILSASLGKGVNLQ